MTPLQDYQDKIRNRVAKAPFWNKISVNILTCPLRFDARQGRDGLPTHHIHQGSNLLIANKGSGVRVQCYLVFSPEPQAWHKGCYMHG
ncbi:MAG: hypothetical protein BAW33_01325 [Desulfobacterales bacterium C00003104]|nr:MAG: hypothetical protein BAW33_01325 [Desulfobacterales bacterium C00003104]